MPAFKSLSRDTVRRLRRTPAGRLAVDALTIAQEPMDFWRRRRAAASCTARATARMRDDDGYLLLPSGSVPGTADVIETCRRLFAIKRAAIEAAAPTGKGSEASAGRAAS